jgi:ATP-dependent protease Clp ATPase subunit
MDRCSFCAKTAKEVNTLITGQGSSICSECVVLCYEMLKDASIDLSLKKPGQVVEQASIQMNMQAESHLEESTSGIRDRSNESPEIQNRPSHENPS